MAYSRIFRALCIPAKFKTLVYLDSKLYHNTILNIFTNVPSWKFETVMNVLLLKILSNFYNNFTVLLTSYFRQIQAYERLIQPYLVLLEHIKNPCILRSILLQAYSKRYAYHLGRFKHI